MLLRRMAFVGAAFALTLVLSSSSPPAAAQGAGSAAAALAGQVASTEEGPMEGVIVSAKKDGSTITISVITNAQGRLQLPGGATRARPVQPANPRGRIRPRRPQECRCRGGQPASADLKLRKTRNLSKQLTNAEWMMSVPGTDDDKLQLINCVSCHTLERVVKSSHDADEFVQVVARMNGYAPGQPADQAAAARRPVARRQSGTLPQGGRVSRHHQSELGHETRVRAQDPAAGQGSRHQRHHHRIRSAARDHRAARRDRRERRRPGTRISASSSWASSIRRPASTPNTPCRSCARASRPAISTSASTARAISCSA